MASTSTVRIKYDIALYRKQIFGEFSLELLNVPKFTANLYEVQKKNIFEAPHTVTPAAAGRVVDFKWNNPGWGSKIPFGKYNQGCEINQNSTGWR